MANCIFCKIASGEIPAKIIYDSQDVMAFLDARPANPGHVLVIPKQHHETLMHLPEELNSVLIQVAKIIAQAQVEALGAQGVNILQNNGPVAGQAVPHVHIHVIPRYKDDKVVFSWEPNELKPEQVDEVQKRLVSRAKELAMSLAGKGETKKPEVIEEPKAEKPKGKQKLPRVPIRFP